MDASWTLLSGQAAHVYVYKLKDQADSYPPKYMVLLSPLIQCSKYNPKPFKNAVAVLYA